MDARRKRSFDDYRMSEEFWQRLRPLLPEYTASPKGGRPRADLRGVADAVFYRLRVGCQWNAIPPQLAAGSTAHDYFQDWVARGIFEAVWAAALREYDELVGIDWRWQSLDGAMTKAPPGGEKTGKNPTDRGKTGTKRSLLTEAEGVPVGLAVAGANVHDKRLVSGTIEGRPEGCPEPPGGTEQNLCMDKGYDYADTRELVREVYDYVAHVRSRGEERRDFTQEERAKGNKPRRRVVERTHGWLNRFRAVLVRWDIYEANHLAGLQLAAAFYTLSLAGVFG